ncbi:glycoside hydrolase family 88 protein [Clostridium grantii]|uniref:Unsaturated chondroitin disaccharide hydrolase n=1 Tax=Clostridium grantii DSM 8605 TaxID=1121316 RepID=A0A1M5Y0E0_9CLOT|nr:glycoside hydrolase family 88 protein [Clostridium grantii]SHI05462.1 unsaturated chondroitin disaccharide hydrolase [Clostridium grantii DSM 8605]
MKNVVLEELKKIDLFKKDPGLTKEQVKAAFKQALNKIDEHLEEFTYKFPGSSSENNVYPSVENNHEWTTGFWTGILWIAYEVTGDEKYREVADIHVKSFEKRIDEKLGLNHHDLGFLYTLSCISAYKITGSEVAKNSAIKAADHLITRYQDKAGIIQAWGDFSDPNQRGRMIIDCNMNLPLLYWASEVTEDPKYKQIAKSHIEQAAKYIVREDASTYHTYYIDTETGEPRFGKTHQGYSDDSCWSRGQAWGIYGFPLSYIYTKDEELLDLTKKVSNYFLNRIPEDNICYWDLIFTDGDEPRDSSAAAIAISGLMELAKWLPKDDEMREIYMNASKYMLKSLIEKYTTKDVPESNGLLLHGVYSKPGNTGVDECNIWGDYYYMESLVRVLKDWELYW